MAKQFLSKKNSDTMSSKISKVKHKLKQVKYRHLQKEIRALYKLEPIICPNCNHLFRVKDKETLKREFNDFMENSTMAEIAFKYPDVAALLWVLETLGVDDSDTKLDFEEIELGVKNQQLLLLLEDMKTISSLQTSEISSLESDNSELLEQLKKEKEKVQRLSAEKAQLSTELELKQESFWSKIMGWWK